MKTMITIWPISTAPCRKQGKRFMKNTITIMRKKAIIMRRKNITATARKTITIMTMEKGTIIMNTAI